MEKIFNTILFYIHQPEYWLVWQLSIYLLYLIFLYLILTQWVIQYVNQKHNGNHLSLSQIVDGMYIMYSPYVYMGVVIIYICYLSVIMGCNLIHDISNWVEYGGQQLKNIIGNLQGEILNNGYDYMLDGTHVTNQNQPEIANRNIYGIIEKTAGVVIGKTWMPPGLVGKKFYDGNLAKSMFLSPREVPSAYINIMTHSHLLEREMFLQDKILLHEFKKAYPQYSNKEIIFIDNPPFKNYKKILGLTSNNLFDWEGIADIIFYDKNDGTCVTSQYKYKTSDNFNEFKKQQFLQKYNHTHVMKIMLLHGHNVEQICEIMKQQNPPFDSWISVHPDYTNLTDELVREVDAADHKFMDRIGYQVKHDFYHQYDKKDFSKFKPDPMFTYQFHEYSQTYPNPGEISIYLPGNNKQ